jgi:predicted permease
MPLRRALKSLLRTPVYAITVILTLALGLASVGAMFAVVHGVLFAPLPYAQSDRLVDIRLELADGSRIGSSPAMNATYRRFATQIEDLAIYRIGRANVGAGQDPAGAENLTATWISASMPRVLQVVPSIGRTFTDDEERRGGPDAVILSAPEWRSRFGAAPDVIGRTLEVNDVVREIVGVMPEGFAFPHAGIRIWLPVKSSDGTTATDFLYSGVARLAPDASAASAQRELAAILPRMAGLYPRLGSGGSTADWIDAMKPAPRVQALRETVTAEVAPTLWLLAAVAGLVLLVAWANVANLTLIRADAARRDVAVRQALGATPLRASAQFLGESLLIGSFAAMLAVVAATVALHALRVFGPTDLPRIAELSIGPWSVGFIAVMAMLGSGFGLLALPRFGQPGSVAGRLRDGAHGQSAGRARHSLRAIVTVLQIAAALVIVTVSALLLRTADRMHDVHPGFEAGQVTTFRILLPFARYGDAARVAFHARLTERVRALPSVLGAGLSARLPLTPGSAPEQGFRVAGEVRARQLPVNVVGDGYFKAMRIPLRAGRDFGSLEAQRPAELLINQRAALQLFADPAGTESLGRTLTLEPGGPSYTVIGVVGDVRYDDLATPPSAMVYRPQVVATIPAQPGPLPGMVLVVRSSGSPDTLVAAVREIVREMDPGVPVFEVRDMPEVVRQSMARLTLILTLTTAAAVVALALGMIGLYGVMAYLVALRTREFGLRMAVGASAARIVGSVFARGSFLASIGVLVGLAVFTVVASSLGAAVHGIQAWDPVALASATLLLFATAVLACWFPARRAAAVDPAQALRAD